ncbi:MAG: proprotein convertase P-domain-containing protein [Labilithrix sp.]|nr:proprotein convertase P-domain-containing protein [Labilithrix sp.]MCW5814195.1 proprotein convertase P-domain-containing protein [Labilithrix sp.]
MMQKAAGFAILVLSGLVACTAAPAGEDADTDVDEAAAATGPGSIAGKGKGGKDDGATCDEPKPEQCSGGGDEDCDGLVDCADPDCSGVGSCPVCGEVDKPEATPLALPDGNDGEGVPYESKLKFKGFDPDKTIASEKDLVKICVTMEHSWLRDLEIKLISPDGKEAILTDFRGRQGNGLSMGEPNRLDDKARPVAGKGAEYCWSADAPNPAMLDSEAAKHKILPKSLAPGSYRPAKSLDSLVGSELNGEWTLRVTDRWSEDNGFIFGWSISFDPSLVANCTAPLVESDVK